MTGDDVTTSPADGGDDGIKSQVAIGILEPAATTYAVDPATYHDHAGRRARRPPAGPPEQADDLHESSGPGRSATVPQTGRRGGLTYAARCLPSKPASSPWRQRAPAGGRAGEIGRAHV